MSYIHRIDLWRLRELLRQQRYRRLAVITSIHGGRVMQHPPAAHLGFPIDAPLIGELAPCPAAGPVPALPDHNAQSLDAARDHARSGAMPGTGADHPALPAPQVRP